jgi:type IV pilus assembly protein PilN
MIRINLLPVRTSKKRETAQRQLVYALLGLLVVGGGCLFLHFQITGEVDAMTAQNAELDAEIKRLKQVIGQVEEFEKKKEALQKKLDIIRTLKARKTGPVHMLDEIASNIPEKCWLTSLSELNKKVTLTGVAINNEVIADFISKLEESGYFDDVYLVSTQQQEEKGGVKLKEFSVTARMTTPEEKKARDAGSATAPVAGNPG